MSIYCVSPFGVSSVANFSSPLSLPIARKSVENVLGELQKMGWSEQDLTELREYGTATHTFEAFLHVLCDQAVRREDPIVVKSLPPSTIKTSKQILEGKKRELQSIEALFIRSKEYGASPIRCTHEDFLPSEKRIKNRQAYFTPHAPMNEWLLERGWDERDIEALNSHGNRAEAFIELAVANEDWEALQSIPEHHGGQVIERLQAQISEIEKELYFLERLSF